MQIPSQARNYEGHPWLMSSPWGFAVETSVHALRLCGSGVFDDFPNLKIILGHMGENIPFALWRVDARMRFHHAVIAANARRVCAMEGAHHKSYAIIASPSEKSGLNLRRIAGG